MKKQKKMEKIASSNKMDKCKMYHFIQSSTCSKTLIGPNAKVETKDYAFFALVTLLEPYLVPYFLRHFAQHQIKGFCFGGYIQIFDGHLDTQESQLRSCLKTRAQIAFEVGIWEKEEGKEGKEEFGHANVLLVDKTKKTIELFEPHGSSLEVEEAENRIGEAVVWLVMNQILTEAEIPSYKIELPHNFCPYSWQTKLPLCTYYSLLYLLLRVGCPNLSRDALLTVTFSSSLDKKHILLLNAFHCFIEKAIQDIQPVFLYQIEKWLRETIKYYSARDSTLHKDFLRKSKIFLTYVHARLPKKARTYAQSISKKSSAFPF
jgi:hypothetical protein